MKTVKEIIESNDIRKQDVLRLYNNYDFYFEYIDDYRQMTERIAKNKAIEETLKEMGVKLEKID